MIKDMDVSIPRVPEGTARRVADSSASAGVKSTSASGAIDDKISGGDVKSGGIDSVLDATKTASSNDESTNKGSVTSQSGAKAAFGAVGGPVGGMVADKASSAISSGVSKIKQAADSAGEEIGRGIGGYGPSVQAEDMSASNGAGGGTTGRATTRKLMAPALAAGGYIALLHALMMMVKMVMAKIFAWLINLIKMIVAAIKGAVKAVIGVALKVGSVISKVTGGLVSAVQGAVVASTAVITSTAMVGTVVTSGIIGANLRRDDKVSSCSDNVVAALADESILRGTTSGVNEALRQENAKKIYSVLSAKGMNKDHIAAMLGNLDVESAGLDPTMVETFHGKENYTYGPLKKDAEASNFDVSIINPDYASRFPAIRHLGIGYVQWTNGRNVNLRAFAKKVGRPWYETDTQLAFMWSDAEASQRAVLETLIKSTMSLDEATLYVLDKYEVTSHDSLDERLKRAKDWRPLIDNWVADKELGDGVLKLAGDAKTTAGAISVNQAVASCITEKRSKVDNSTAWKAALSYAYPTEAASEDNDGTPLYREVHDYVFGSEDKYYQSCDRSVIAAVRWSGQDDNIPAGAVVDIAAYMDKHTDRWKSIPWGGDRNKLKPGDLLLRTDGGVQHIIMYVGIENVHAAFGSASPNNAEVVSGSIAGGSIKGRSPGVGMWDDNTSIGYSTYKAYRNIKPESSSKFSSFVPKSGTTSGLGVIGNPARTGASGIDYTTLNKFLTPPTPSAADYAASSSYAEGNCTLYAAARRRQLGKPVGPYWGNGGQWADSARKAGVSVSDKPQVGDVFSTTYGVYGHVGIVEIVNLDGSIVVSEMNNTIPGHPETGFGKVNTMLWNSYEGYSFIH